RPDKAKRPSGGAGCLMALRLSGLQIQACRPDKALRRHPAMRSFRLTPCQAFLHAAFYLL
ncbi:hypothetical protein, partial [Salmonella enterica]|uniref:hypothetical protein n=1 Tax=Salmonella enterica TaxID=28901 RepID=UPI001CB831AC